MIRKAALVLTFSIMLLALSNSSVLAQVRTVGVSEGDWFKHGEIDVDWQSNDTSATFPPYGWDWIGEWNETEWMLATVESISGTNITSQTTEYFKNGSEEIRSGWIDIDTGNSTQMENETMDMTFMFILADLAVNDSVYSSAGYSEWKINETVLRVYPDISRETNHINLTWEYSFSNGVSTYYYQSMNYYWDRSTGILVEWSIDAINQTGQYLTTWSVFSRITESNMWTVPEFFPPVTIALGSFIATLTLVVIYRRNQKIHK
jgi:hypothetical protein